MPGLLTLSIKNALAPRARQREVFDDMSAYGQASQDGHSAGALVVYALTPATTSDISTRAATMIFVILMCAPLIRW